MSATKRGIKLLSLVQTSTKRKSIIIALVIIVVLVASSIGTVVYLLTKDNVTVSGQAGVSGGVVLAAYIQTIEFTDTQTGTTTSSHFTFAPQTHNFGNYSVSLKNGHTYNIYITFSVFNHNEYETQFITTFTVNAAAGQKEITKGFMWPNPPEGK
jgi:flagellar basal body-associated protein FliL